MKSKSLKFLTGAFALSLAVTSTGHAATYYWDLNGATANTGTSATGAWDGINVFWNDDSDGTGGTAQAGTTNADDLIFSSGTGYTTGGTIALSGERVTSSITFEENRGYTLSGGTSLTLGGSGTKDGIFLTTAADQNVSISTALILNGNNTFETEGAGVLTLSGGVSGTGNLILRNNDVNANGITISGGSLNNTGTVTNSGDNSGDVLISADIGSSVTDVTQNSTGSALILSGANAHTGLTTISSGFLNIRHANALGGTGSGTSVTSGAALQIQGGIITASEALALDGTGISNTGALRNISGDNTYTGAITINSSNRINSDSGTLTLDVASGNAITGSDDNLTFGGAGNITVSDAIATGTGSLTKDGNGTLTLSGTNTYSGVTAISAGVLQANDGTGLPTGSFLSLDGGVLQGDGIASFTRSLATSGSSKFQWTANGGGFAANGGKLTVTIANDAATELVWGTTVGSQIVGTLDFGSATANAETEFQNKIDLGNATRTVDVASGTGGDFATLSGVIRNSTGTGNLTKTGAGTLVLSGINTYNGVTTISGGVVKVKNATSLGSTAAGTTVTTGATIQIDGSSLNVAETITSLAGDGGGTGALRNLGNNNEWSGAITIPNGGARINSDSGNLTLSGGISESGNSAKTLTFGGAGNITVNSLITQVDDTVSVVKDGSGILTLSGASNAFTGSTTVNGGILTLDYASDTTKLANTAALILGGGSVYLTGGSHTEVVSAATINAGASAITRNVSGTTATLQLNVITRNAGGTLDLGTASIATTDTDNDANGILGTWFTVAGTDWATETGSGNENPIAAYSGYTDVTRLSSGSKAIANGDTTNVRIIEGTGSAADITLGATTTVINTLNQSISGGTSAATIDAASKTLRVGGILVGTGAGGLTIGTAANSGTLTAKTAGGELILHNHSSNGLTINSTIDNNSSASALTKSGTGTVTLNGNNIYDGLTSINAGTLVVNGNQSGATGAMSVASVAALLGTGTIGGATTILGTHSSGASAGAVGTQNFSSSLTYSSGSIFAWDINVSGLSETHDKVVAGSLLGSGAEFKIVGSGDGYATAFWNTTRNWTASDLFGATNANVNLANIFSAAATTTNFTANSLEGLFSFTDTGGGTSNQLTWTAVPEPTSALAGILIGAGLLRRRRNS